MLILLKIHRCFGHGLKMCILFRNLDFVFFQALLLSTYVDSMYLVRVIPPTTFIFSDDSLFLKKNL